MPGNDAGSRYSTAGLVWVVNGDTPGLDYLGESEKWKEMKGCRSIQSISVELVHSKDRSGFPGRHQHAGVCDCLCLGKPGLPLTKSRRSGKSGQRPPCPRPPCRVCTTQRRPAEGTVGAEILFALPLSQRPVSSQRAPFPHLHRGSL